MMMTRQRPSVNQRGRHLSAAAAATALEGRSERCFHVGGALGLMMLAVVDLGEDLLRPAQTTTTHHASPSVRQSTRQQQQQQHLCLVCVCPSYLSMRLPWNLMA